jgi:hypothetical protein
MLGNLNMEGLTVASLLSPRTMFCLSAVLLACVIILHIICQS